MDTIAIERACERLVLDFVFFSDHQQNEALSQLFAANGVMHRPSGDSVIGRDAIYQAISPGLPAVLPATSVRTFESPSIPQTVHAASAML